MDGLTTTYSLCGAYFRSIGERGQFALIKLNELPHIGRHLVVPQLDQRHQTQLGRARERGDEEGTGG